MAALLALFAFASCDDIVDYEDGYTPAESLPNTGAPVITAVYDIQDTAMANPITKGEVGQTVRIEGRNLNHAKSIKFNTVEADLSGVYTFSTGAIVQIPMELSLARENCIEYTTDMGTARYDFAMPIPTVQVDGLLCEFANAGDSVTILGRNFNLYGFGTSSHVTLNGTELGLGSITSTSMKAAIPEGTPENSDILVSWTDGETGEAMTATLPFRPTGNLLYGDMTETNFNVTGLEMDIETDNDAYAEETSLGRPHMHFTGHVTAWSWNQIDLSQNLIDIDGVDVGSLPAEELDGYVLKFEIYNSNNYPLTGGTQLRSCFNWSKARYEWNIGDGAGINTHEEWQTITMPLAELAKDGFYGTAGSRWASLSIVFYPDADYDADFRMGNFRIEKK